MISTMFCGKHNGPVRLECSILRAPVLIIIIKLSRNKAEKHLVASSCQDRVLENVIVKYVVMEVR